jgi:cobalt transporter subunit CbtB
MHSVTTSVAEAAVRPVPAVRQVSRAAALCAALLGALILFGAGFSHPTVAHNAAHDARHAQGFPCH